MGTGPLPPPPDIVRSAYAELVVTDLARARWFWGDVLGFVVTESGPGLLYLRGTTPGVGAAGPASVVRTLERPPGWWLRWWARAGPGAG
jgi:catechol 2,3-dioxygenase-like lactoylglutathione lyase family enzyme